jgi:DNA-binding GntR family transcriptional regulator
MRQDDDAETTMSASERVAAYLRTAILEGTIAPGTRIRQEDIAERLGASRLPVREALRMLELEGLTELEVNKGARVPTLDPGEFALVYQMRERLEPLALTESIPNLTAIDLQDLDGLQEQIAATDDIVEFLRLDREFHLRSYSGCQFAQLITNITRLWNTTQHYRRTFMLMGMEHRHQVVNAEHGLILDAIHRRDAVDGERYLSGHIRRTRIELMSALEQRGSTATAVFPA